MDNYYNNREQREPREYNSRDAKGKRDGKRDAKGGFKQKSPPRKPAAKFQLTKDVKIEYKNLALIQKFLTDRGKIVPRRISGVSAKEQRLLCSSIKKARFLGLLSTGGIKK